jgi:hypothetical protein
MFRIFRRFFSLAFLSLLINACVSQVGTSSNRVYFAEPANDSVVKSPFKVKFGITGMEVKPAGDDSPNSGHHHVLVNLDAVPSGQSIPFSPTHIHFGKGQTEGEINLPPGTYTLTLQFADKDHVSYGKGLSNTIRVTIK